MTKKMIPSVVLALKMKNILSRKGVKAGMRLLTERDLAQTLQCGSKCIRAALQLLNDERILSKRHGSGNYLRKIPQLHQGEELSVEFAVTDIIPASEFEPEDAPKLSLLPEQQRLIIQLWSGFHRPGNENFPMYQKIQEQIELHGHVLEPHEIVDIHWKSRPTEDITAELQQHPADGYLVSSPLGEHFAKSYRLAFGREPDNVIYISSWGYETPLEPIIRQDGHEAIIRGVRNFYNKGKRQIAFLGLEQLYHSGRIDRYVYDLAMNLCGLEFRLSCHVEPSDNATCQAMKSLLTAHPMPEAVLIADDKLLNGVERAFADLNLVPGQDIDVIIIRNSASGKPEPRPYSSIDFNRDLIGALAADEMLKLLLNAGTELRSIALLGKWNPYQTNQINNGKTIA